MIAQYIGKKDSKEVGRSFYTNLAVSLILVAVFTFLSLGIPSQILRLYTNDTATVQAGVEYLRIYAFSFLPVAVTSILAAYLRCVEAAKIPLYAGIFASIANTVLNYVLIFGKAGFPAMGVKGAAWASFIAQLLGCIITVVLFLGLYKKNSWKIPFEIRLDRAHLKQYLAILMPLLVCEFFWSLGENVYAVVAPLKVQNMIMGGILRSGGRTTYVMIIDLIGTWVFGVPLGLLTAFVFHLPIAAVYFILSMEEGIRVIISCIVFGKKKWMQRL